MGGIELTLGMLLLLVMLMLKLINMAMLMQRCEGKNMHGLLLLSDERNWPCHRSRGGPQGPLYHECALYSKLFIFETPGLILYSKPFISKLICLIILYTLNTTTGNDQRCKKDEWYKLFTWSVTFIWPAQKWTIMILFGVNCSLCSWVFENTNLVFKEHYALYFSGIGF